MNLILKIKTVMKNYLPIFRIGIITAMVIVLFEIINLFVVYNYLKLDYYLSLVALVFLITGLLINSISARDKNHIRRQTDLLTNKEMQILGLIAKGKTNKEIASAQFIEVSTVKTHINNIYSKLSIHNRREARIKFNELEIK